jgi:hypothetical protein
MTRILPAALSLLAFLPAIFAEDKSAYHLFRPVPDSLMREMSTDRPDVTESPYTVDAGHWQLEMSFFDYTRNRADDIRSQVWSLGMVNLKAGLWNHTDLQLVFETYTAEKTNRPHTSERTSGFSDVTLRLKTNLWGDENGTTALSLMPYVKIPTGTDLSNGKWEGGMIVPLAITLSDRISLGLMAVAGLVYLVDTGRHEWELLHSATIGIELTDDFGMYVEMVGIAGQKTGYWALFSAGLTFSATNNLIFDAGVRLGLNGDTDDLAIFTGVSIRY